MENPHPLHPADSGLTMNRLTPLLLLLVACDCGGTPVLDTCMTEAECAVGEQCVDMMCLQSGCSNDEECPVNFACIDTLCVPGGDTCTGDEMCMGGQVCVDDRCQAALCVDPDMDGFGPGCPRGSDCDNDDPMQTGVEVCDGRDNDCDGVADNGVQSACGDCNPDCNLGGIGGPGGTPFMPDETNSDGVGVNPDGALELDARSINTNFIWIANTPEGSVSRFSTTPPYNEVGRYFTDVDPSRTSVNSVGDAFVGNRRGGSITRISVLGADCPDTNGDGVVTTSTDLNGDGVISTAPADGEMLPFGEDDCLLWRTDDVLGPTENFIRAVAAQDVEGPDGELQEFVWVGGYVTNTLAKLDARDGSIILTTAAPSNPYGFALDGTGKLWVSTRAGNFLGFLDTTRCVDAASCDVPVCRATAEGAECDGEIKALIPAPFTLYGVTVDFNQRVWVGGGGIARYDITAASGSRWANVALPFGGSIAIHGIAADAEGFVWGAGQGNGIARVDAETLANTVVVGTTGASNKGMAIDFEGKIWSITQASEAIVITPGPTLMENTVERGVATSITSPYTYSDMTGIQLRLATNPRGYYRHVFEGCPAGTTTMWNEIRFDADIPAGTSVSFRVRTASTRDALDAAEWVQVGSAPPETSPLDIATALMDAGVEPEAFLMIEIVLSAERMSTTEVITPRVSSTDVTHVCPPILG
ncbi:MAG: hypothetical protein ACI9KE_004332 [Polyangiales bacterium]|jgi:hypothetical protein